MLFTRPIPNVIHVHALNQFELTSTFVRLQEFYESPYETIRGRYGWTVKDLASTYVEDGKDFDYFTKWNGMNVPGDVVRDFFAHFYDLTPDEVGLNATVWRAIQEGVDHKKFYLIGTHDGGDVAHEIAHAMYYLDYEYTIEMINRIKEASPSATARLTHWLLDDREYSSTVLHDELQAYFATSPLAYLKEKMGDADGEAVFNAGEPFRVAFKEYTGIEPI